MDYVAHFHREVQAFEAAGRRAVAMDEAPIVPSCAEWTVSDLVLHLSGVHRLVTAVIADRMTAPPAIESLAHQLPANIQGWPHPERAPTFGPVPVGLVDWFAEGAAVLEKVFATTDPSEPVWTWSADQTAGFWLRMQVIEAAVHRWDAENAVGQAAPMDTELAADAVAQTFEVMVPARREMANAPRGAGETYRFRQSDGPGDWTIRFEGDSAQLSAGAADVELSGTASQLMLFLWQRCGADELAVSGDRDVLDRYFTLVPPI